MHESSAGTGHGSTSPADMQPPRRPSLLALFLLFSELGLSSFGGGVSAWIHRACVERRGWLTESEFAAALALARIMPGANVINLAIIVAQRQRGVAGALAAALGLLVGPGLVVIALAALYQRFAEADVLASMLEGTAAAAVGLILAMGLTSGMSIVSAAFKSGGPTRHGIVAVCPLVDEVQIDALQGRAVLLEGIEIRLLRAPVVLVLPVGGELSGVREARPVAPPCARDLVRPARAVQALVQIGKKRLGQGDPEQFGSSVGYRRVLQRSS